MTPLKVLLISDRRPGHYHLAEGILAAIARRRAVEVVRVDVRRRPWAPGRILAMLVNGGISPSVVLRYGYGIDASSLPPADLVVSAGGDTLAANVAAARLLEARNIFYGSLRRFRSEDFALVLTSHARYGARPRHAMTLKPSPIDPETFARGMPAPAAPLAGTPAFIGLLVGGNTGTVRYVDHDWDRLINFVRELHHAHGTRWIVSNSRRTPAEASDRLMRLAAQEGGPVESFIDVRAPGAQTLSQLFADSEAIMTTVDSSSMVSEAVWAQRPAIVIAPATSRLPDHEQEYRDYLEANGWARALAIADLTPQRVTAALADVKPLAVNPMDRLADLLSERLPALFAGRAS